MAVAFREAEIGAVMTITHRAAKLHAGYRRKSA